MSPLSPWATPGSSPLTAAPALVLCAGKESAVLTGGSPTRAAPAAALPAFFPCDGLRVVAAAPGSTRRWFFTIASFCRASRRSITG
jgi:hypothetical protein